jgi:hypothetical protein
VLNEQPTLILHRKVVSDLLVSLTSEEGQAIKNLLFKSGVYNHSTYCKKIGIQSSNYHNILTGNRTCTIDVLNRILSGIGYEAHSSTTIRLQPILVGETVPDVCSNMDEDESASDTTESVPTETKSQSEFSLLERLLEQQKTPPEFHFRVVQDE